MSKIIPFPALIPKPQIAQRVVCPPYDVLSSAEARELAGGNPYSLLHITKAEVDFPPDVGEDDDRVYARARENLKNFEEKGWLVRDDASFYVYRIESRGRAQTGLVCGASVDEYDSGLIKKHELTKKDKEDNRTRLAATLNAHMEPVLFACRSDSSIKSIIASPTSGAPLYDVIAGDKTRHMLWRVRATERVTEIFSGVRALYIADGHHRSATASRVREMKRRENPAQRETEACNFFPVVIFPDDELCVYRYDWNGPPEKRPPADVTIEDIMRTADEGGIMPPKSTWFSPKLISGLFVYTL